MKRQRWRRLRHGLLLSLALLATLILVAALLLAGGLLWLDSGSGQRWLVARLNAALAEDGVTLGDMQGSIYGEFSLHTLRLHDSDGVWLEARDIAVSWRPWSLLERHALIDSLHIGGVSLMRLPGGEEDASTDTAWLSLPALPDLPVSLALDRLDVPQAEIDAAAFGQAATLAIAAQDIRYASGIAALDLRIERSDTDADRATLDLAYDRAAARLDLSAEIAGAPGGLLAGITGAAVGEGVDLRLTGAGPLDDWRGRLEVSRGEALKTQADVSYRDFVLQVDSTTSHAALLSPALEQVLGRSAVISLKATLDRRPVLPLDIKVSSDAGRIELAGAATFDDDDAALDFGWNFKTARELSFSEYDIVLGGAQVAGRLNGTLSAPVLHADTVLRDARLPGGVGFEELRLQAGGDWNGQTLELQAAVQVSPLAIDGLAPFPLDARVAGRYEIGQALITLADWRLESGGAVVSGSGRYGLADGALAVDARIERVALDSLPVTVPVTGSLTGDVSLNRPDGVTPLTLKTDLAGQGLSGLYPALDDIIGSTPRLVAALALDGDLLRLEAVTLTGAHATLETSGRIGLSGPDMGLGFRLAFNDLAQLYPAAEAQTGEMLVTGRVDGMPGDLRATAVSRLGAATLQGVTLRDMVLSADGRDLAGQPALSLSLTAQSGLGPLDARLEAAMAADSSIAVPVLDLSLGRLSATGDLRIAQSGLASGRISGRILEADEDAAPSAIAGSGQFTLDLEDGAGAQVLRITAGGQDLRLDPAQGALATIESLALDGDLRFEDSLPAGDMRLQITNADRGFSRLSRLLVTVQAADAGAVLDATVEGDWRGPLELDATVEAHGLDTQPALSLTTSGRLFGLPVATTTPPLLQQTVDGWTLSDMDVRIGEGRLAGEAQTGAANATLRLAASNLPLELLSAALPALSPSGRFDLDVDIRQEGEDPAGGTAALMVKGLKPLTPGLMNTPAVDLEFDAALDADRLTLDGTAGGAAGLSADLSADLPFALDLATGRIEMAPDAAFTASMDWRGNIAPLFMSLNMATHEAQGQMEAALRASGTLADPRLDGSLRLEDGRYEHLDSGFLADDLMLTVKLDNDRIVLENLAATDGGGGRLLGGGDALWRDGGLARADLTLALKQMTVLRRSDATATVSADIDYRLKDGESGISGSIMPDRAEVSIARSLPDEIQTLEVVELNPQQDDEPRQREDIRLRTLPTQLDLTVEARNSLFVRGRGLDSEWRADLQISGATDAPRIRGTARLVKGVFDFASHRFTLDEGELLFAGGSRIDPDIRIVASETVNGIDFRIDVTGRAASPQIDLSSIPVLPEDEILARLLFGESVGNLSALEAVQLASAVSSLSGDGGNFDLVGKLRGTLGLDRLSVDLGSETGGPTVSGGKYLSDDVYFEVAADTASGETKGIVNWDLTRHLNIRGTVASSRDSTISLRWRWSY